MLSEQQLAYRRGKITASDARMIMNAQSDAEMLHLFNIKIGAEPPEPETYAMRAGTAMEPVIIGEYETRSDMKVTRRQEIVDHPTIKDFCCTLDGFHASLNRVIECKFASPFMGRDELFRFYYPQVAFQMACTDAADGVLVVGQGTNEPIEIECMRDPFGYERELLLRCEAFLFCMKTMAPPCALPVVIPPEKWRTVDLDRDEPNWAFDLKCLLAAYDEAKPYVDLYEDAATKAKALIPEDVGRVVSKDHTISRNKKGVLTIRRAA